MPPVYLFLLEVEGTFAPTSLQVIREYGYVVDFEVVGVLSYGGISVLRLDNRLNRLRKMNL